MKVDNIRSNKASRSDREYRRVLCDVTINDFTFLVWYEPDGDGIYNSKFISGNEVEYNKFVTEDYEPDYSDCFDELYDILNPYYEKEFDNINNDILDQN